MQNIYGNLSLFTITRRQIYHFLLYMACGVDFLKKSQI